MSEHNGHTPRPIPVGDEPSAMTSTAPTGRHPHKPSKAKRKTAERFATVNGFVDFALAGLNRAEIAVWLILWRDTRDGSARTAVSDLARRAGCDRRTAFRALRRLESARLVKVIYRGGLGRGPSRYRVFAFAGAGG